MSNFDNNIMARLPVPGSDSGDWGTILNDYLSTSHTSDGNIKPGVIENAHIQEVTITKAKLSSAVQASLNKADASLSVSNADATYIKSVNGAVPDGNGDVTVGQPDVAYVFVQTGNEVRPAVGHVIWVGSATRPTNTIDGDIWLSES